MGEHKEQSALFQWASYAQASLPELRLLFAIPNGGHRHKVTAAKMKVEGVKRGVPDICLPVSRSYYHGLYIELKTHKGRASGEQKRWIARLNDEGYHAVIRRGWNDARQELETYLNQQKGETP